MRLLTHALLVILVLPLSAFADPPVLRHGSYVHSVVFSADGKHLASASNDETVRIWDPIAAKEYRRFAAEKEYIRAVAFSPDGRLLATGSKEKLVSLWQTETGKRLSRLTGHQGDIHAVAFSPDGRLLVSGGEASELIVWDAAEAKIIHRLPAPHKAIHSIAFSLDGKVVAAAGRQDSMIVYWDPLTGKEMRRSRGKHGGIAALALSPDGKTLAAGGSGPVRFYDAASLTEVGQQSVRADGPFDGIYALAYSFDGKYLITGGQDKSVRLFELATQEEVRAWKGLHDWVYSLSFAPDGRTLAVADHGYAVRLWDVTGAAAEKAKPPGREDLEALWRVLDDTDATRAHQAVWRLASVPETSVPFLRERLAKLPASPDRVGPLLKDLDSGQFERQQRAGRELERLGRAAEPALRKALAGRLPSLELRRRIERIMEQVDQPITDPEVLLALRVTATLERMGTAPARTLLASLAKPETETWLVKEARAAHQRLVKSQK